MSLLYWLLGLDNASTIAGAKDWSFQSAAPVPMALIILIIVAAAAVAALNLLPQNIMRWRTRLVLTAVRLACFALLLAMVVRLGVRLTLQRQSPPNVAVMVDTSGSMNLADAGGRSRLEAARAISGGPLAELGRKANVATYDFGWRVDEHDANRVPTGMTRLIDSIADVAERERDLQAIVVLTDGKDTAGNSGSLLAPLLAGRKLPVYPVVFGNPDAPRLAKVRITSGDAYVRLGDELRLGAVVTAQGLGEQTVAVRLMEEGKSEPLASRENVRVGDKPVEVNFVIKPARVGPRVYRVVMQGAAELGKGAPGTLVAEHRVQVLDAKIRVLYVDVPRDERKILGHWLALDPVVDLAELTMLPQGGWYAQGSLRHKNAGDGLPDQEGDLYKYDVIIVGDIPRGYFRLGGDVAETKMQRLVEFVVRRGGGLVTLGGRNAYAAGQYQGSSLAGILPFDIDATDKTQVTEAFRLSPTVAGLAHPVMQLEADPQGNRDAWFDLPTLDGCNRVGKVKPGATLLATCEAGGTGMGVLALLNAGKGKVLSMAMDTTWRWEMLRSADGEDYFRRFWGNVVRYLAPDPRIEPGSPQITSYQSVTPVGQRISLATRLVDGVFKPITGAALEIKVTSPSGKVTRIYPRDGREAPGLYEYEITLNEAGSWTVAATHNDKTTTEEIVAGEDNEEMDDPRACPAAMADFAQATGGKAFAPDQAAALVSALQARPYRYSQTVSVALWNLPLTLVLLALGVCLDCFLRKRRGMV